MGSDTLLRVATYRAATQEFFEFLITVRRPLGKPNAKTVVFGDFFEIFWRESNKGITFDVAQVSKFIAADIAIECYKYCYIFKLYIIYKLVVTLNSSKMSTN